MNLSDLNKTFVTMVFVECVLLSGILGYRYGKAEVTEQPIQYVTIQYENLILEYTGPDILPEQQKNSEETDVSMASSVKTDSMTMVQYSAPPDAKAVSHTFTDREVDDLAKTVWGEARGETKTEQAAVVWTVLNRLDDGSFGKDIATVITTPQQFTGYKSSNPVTSEIRELVVDVLNRYAREKSGEENVGRVLPKNYLYFVGDGKQNYFSTKWRSKYVWDWSLESPYE